jgi:hypothetical protein
VNVSPPWGLGSALAKALPQSRGRLPSVCSQTLAQSRQRTHGGLTPPAPGCTCVCASRKSPFHRHAFAHSARSGGREPAVGIGIALATTLPLTHGRPPTVRAPIAGAVAAANPRGAYAPRSCCIANVCRRKNDFCDARTHIHKSGGRQPAVGIANASAVALVCHGRLTPTALVLRCERLPAKKRFFRCTNARPQERRASARRG